MKAATVTFFALCLFTGGCQTAGSSSRNIHFVCDNGSSLKVRFEGGRAIVTPEGSDPVTLPQALAADGFFYESPQHSLRGKGSEITWTVGRMVPIQCKVG